MYFCKLLCSQFVKVYASSMLDNFRKTKLRDYNVMQIVIVVLAGPDISALLKTLFASL